MSTFVDGERRYFESFLWVAVVLVVAGELPDNNGFVSGGGKDHVGIFRRRSQCCDPAIVTCNKHKEVKER